jgi:hypothetical protein
MELAWLRPRGASLAELRDQLGHAETAHQTALQATATALSAFDDTGSDSSAKALQVAEKAAEQTARVLARAKRLLAEAEQARSEEQRRAKERRAKELQSLLADLSRPNELVGDEVKAWRAVVEARVARTENELELARLDSELSGLEGELGLEKSVRLNRPGGSLYAIAKALDAECQSLPAGTRRQVLNDLVYTLAPNGVKW